MCAIKFPFLFFFLFPNRFIVTAIKSNIDYSRRSIYWLGAEYSKSNNVEWTDGTKMSFVGWMTDQENVSKAQSDFLCLCLQWKQSPTPMLQSNFYWAYQKCSHVGGYVCKKSRRNNDLIQNQTITGIEGRLTSPDYPNQYAPSINYWIRIIAPEKSRIVMQFQKLDIEHQQECLYDYISVQDADFAIDAVARHIGEQFFEEDDIKMSSSGENDNDLKRNARTAKYYNKAENVTVVETAFPLQSRHNRNAGHAGYIRWCGFQEGDMSQFKFVSKSNEILLNFHSDHSIAGEGFSAVWRSVDISACPSQTLTSKEGVITSPNFPNFLLHNLTCSWTIQAPTGRKIWIEFNSFDIVSDASLQVDLGNRVLFHPFNEPDVLGTGVFLSSGEKFTVVLNTGMSPEGKGFKATFHTGN